MDGIVTIKDATIVSMHLVGSVQLDDSKILTADVNKDGTVHVSDVTYIQKNIAEII